MKNEITVYLEIVQKNIKKYHHYQNELQSNCSVSFHTLQPFAGQEKWVLPGSVKFSV